MTELDFTILAIIGRDQPLSAYDVRKVFARSLTPTWSSSTGSIYPSIRRLELAGLAAASPAEGSRSRKLLRITAAGKKAIGEWLTEISPATAGPTPDPVRTRAYFLVSMTPRDRAAFIGNAVRSTEAALAQAGAIRQGRLGGPGDFAQRLASEGVLYELRARLDWLRWLEGQLDSLDPLT
jgi:DNA-binding PadR family transcriptional regulator